jgi:hypothetical protein
MNKISTEVIRHEILFLDIFVDVVLLEVDDSDAGQHLVVNEEVAGGSLVVAGQDLVGGISPINY